MSPPEPEGRARLLQTVGSHSRVSRRQTALWGVHGRVPLGLHVPVCLVWFLSSLWENTRVRAGSSAKSPACAAEAQAHRPPCGSGRVGAPWRVEEAGGAGRGAELWSVCPSCPARLSPNGASGLLSTNGRVHTRRGRHSRAAPCTPGHLPVKSERTTLHRDSADPAPPASPSEPGSVPTPLLWPPGCAAKHLVTAPGGEPDSRVCRFLWCEPFSGAWPAPHALPDALR